MRNFLGKPLKICFACTAFRGKYRVTKKDDIQWWSSPYGQNPWEKAIILDPEKRATFCEIGLTLWKEAIDDFSEFKEFDVVYVFGSPIQEDWQFYNQRWWVFPKLIKEAVGDDTMVFMCYDNQTEVLTYLGWKKLQDVAETDLICTLKDGEIIEYQHPTNVWGYPYVGDLLHFKNRQVDLLVTPNHNLYTMLRSTGTTPLRNNQGQFTKWIKKHLKDPRFEEFNSLVAVYQTCNRLIEKGKLKAIKVDGDFRLYLNEEIVKELFFLRHLLPLFY